jgi:hypothetical protein
LLCILACSYKSTNQHYDYQPSHSNYRAGYVRQVDFLYKFQFFILQENNLKQSQPRGATVPGCPLTTVIASELRTIKKENWSVKCH